jgi:hypothetical protein
MMMCNCTCYPQFSNFSCVQSSFKVEGAKKISLNCFEGLLWTKNQFVIFLSVVGRSSLLTYAQQDLEWSLQLIEFLVVSTKQL